MGNNQERVRPAATIGEEDEGTKGYLALDDSGWAWAVAVRSRATPFREHLDVDHNTWFTVARGIRKGWYLSANLESCYGLGVYSEWRNSCYWVCNDICKTMQCCVNGFSASQGRYVSCEEGKLLCEDESPSPECRISKIKARNKNEIYFRIDLSMDVTESKADLINVIERARWDPKHSALKDSQFRITSMNVRNVEDDWPKRMTPLIDELKSTNSDVYNLQESASEQRDFFEKTLAGSRRQSDRWIDHGLQTCVNESALANRNYLLPNHTYQRFSYSGLVHIRGFLVERVVKGNASILVLNTHLHWTAGSSRERLAQTRQILAWLNDPPEENFEWNSVILTGDFNGEPGEPFHQELVAAGFKSAMKKHYQRELPTYKMGDVMTENSSHGDSGKPFQQTLDYIWYKGCLKLESVHQIGTKSIDVREYLFPSDHAGLVATFRIVA